MIISCGRRGMERAPLKRKSLVDRFECGTTSVCDTADTTGLSVIADRLERLGTMEE